MTNAEQVTTIQELSNVISHKMGLREQLEVIRIMNPQANVMHSDTEFIIGKFRIRSDGTLQRRKTRVYAFNSLRQINHGVSIHIPCLCLCTLTVLYEVLLSFHK